jgi:hypothetical protein
LARELMCGGLRDISALPGERGTREPTFDLPPRGHRRSIAMISSLKERPFSRPRRLALLSALALAAAGLAPSVASALTFPSVPGLDQLAATAPLIVRGQVTAIDYDVVRADATHAQPVTAVHLRVLSGLKGAQVGQEVTLRLLGGPLAADQRVWMRVGGLPDYTVGAEVIAFVDDRAHPFFGTAYGDHGLLRVARSADGQRRVLTAGWETMVNGPNGFATDGGKCLPVTNDPARCSLASSPSDVAVDFGAPLRAAAPALTVDALEARIRAHAGPAPAGPVQTVSASAPAFAQAVVALLNGDGSTIHRLTGTEVGR